ncbi:MAG: radical SAM protein [Candidatus Buchananbacteria bacterium]
MPNTIKKPHILLIAINDKCNYKCLHCDCSPQHISGNKKFSKKQWIKLINDFADYGGKIISIIYKEPLLTIQSRKKVAAIIMTAKKKGLRCGFINNGSKFKNFIQEWPNLKIDFVDFSIEGLKINQEQIRINSSFKSVEESICLANKNKNVKQINLIFTINKLNYSEIKQFVNYFARLNKINYIFDTWIPYKNSPPNFGISKEVYLKNIFPVLSSLGKKYPNRIILDFFSSSFRNNGLFKNIQKNGKKIKLNTRDYLIKYKNFFIRYENPLLLFQEAIIISPQGKIIRREALNKFNYLQDNFGYFKNK